MPSPHRIAELQADNFAEDLELPPDVAGWSEASVVAFLESGGVTTTAASAASFDATTAVSAESAATAAPPPVTALESGVVHISAEGGAAPLGRRVRVACLHGSAGNERIFKIQTSRLLAALQAAGAGSVRGREGGGRGQRGRGDDAPLLRRRCGAARVRAAAARRGRQAPRRGLLALVLQAVHCELYCRG